MAQSPPRPKPTPRLQLPFLFRVPSAQMPLPPSHPPHPSPPPTAPGWPPPPPWWRSWTSTRTPPSTPASSMGPPAPSFGRDPVLKAIHPIHRRQIHPCIQLRFPRITIAYFLISQAALFFLSCAAPPPPNSRPSLPMKTARPARAGGVPAPGAVQAPAPVGTFAAYPPGKYFSRGGRKGSCQGFLSDPNC